MAVSVIPTNNFGAKVLANGSSINDVTAQRLDSYSCEGWADAPTSGNNNGTLLIIPRAWYGSNLTQVYISTNVSAGVFVRSRLSSGSYTSWYQLSLTAVS